MRVFITIFGFILVLFSEISAKTLNPSEVLKRIETGDQEKLYSIFQNIEELTLDEAKSFVEDLFAIIKYKYEEYLLDMDILFIKQFLLDYIKTNEFDSEKTNEIEKVLEDLTSDLIKKETRKISFQKTAKA